MNVQSLNPGGGRRDFNRSLRAALFGGEFEDAKRWPVGQGPPHQGERDVVDRDAGGGATLRGSVVGVSVDDGGHRMAVEGLSWFGGATGMSSSGPLESAGYRTEVSFPHWLAKAFGDDGFVDVIFSSGNSVAEVDEEWFTHASQDEILGVPVSLCPAEEMIWHKGYVQERERFDGADEDRRSVVADPGG
jgi:hypothetical protein